MNSNNETPVPAASEREAARARLARQIGRLLAHEWLNYRDLGRVPTMEKLSGKDLPPGADASAHEPTNRLR